MYIRMCSRHHIPAKLPLKKSPGTRRTEAEWALGLAWTQEKTSYPR